MKGFDTLCLYTPVDLFGMNVDGRRKFLTAAMERQYVGQKYYCPALGCEISVTKKSVHETASHASKSTWSTIAALNLPQIIELTQFVKSAKPKQGTQTKKFNAIRTYVLLAVIGQMVAKLTVVKNRKGARLEYCITAKLQENL